MIFHDISVYFLYLSPTKAGRYPPHHAITFCFCSEVLLAGEKKLVGAYEMIRSVVPQLKMERPLAPDLQYSAVVVFCPADYTPDAPHSYLNHWVPAWPADQLEEPQKWFQGFLRAAQQAGEHQVAALEARRPMCLEDVEILSLNSEIEIQKQSTTKFISMQQDLYHNHGLLAQHVGTDGSCGVYSCLALIKDQDPAKVTENEVLEFRNSLKTLWLGVSSDPVWQHVWMQMGHSEDAVRNKKKKCPETEKEKNDKDLPFTPEKVGGKKRLCPSGALVALGLPFGYWFCHPKQDAEPSQACSGFCDLYPTFGPGTGNAEEQGILVPGLQAQEPEAKKKKRTGKKLPVVESINFSKYFDRWMAEVGITYKNWVKAHSTATTIVLLDCVFHIAFLSFPVGLWFWNVLDGLGIFWNGLNGFGSTELTEQHLLAMRRGVTFCAHGNWKAFVDKMAPGLEC